MFQQNGNGSLMNMGTWYTYNRKNSMHIKRIKIVAVVGHDTDHTEWYQNNISDITWSFEKSQKTEISSSGSFEHSSYIFGTY